MPRTAAEAEQEQAFREWQAGPGSTRVPWLPEPETEMEILHHALAAAFAAGWQARAEEK